MSTEPRNFLCWKADALHLFHEKDSVCKTAKIFIFGPSQIRIWRTIENEIMATKGKRQRKRVSSHDLSSGHCPETEKKLNHWFAEQRVTLESKLTITSYLDKIGRKFPILTPILSK